MADEIKQNDIREAWATLEAAAQDPEYAWALHCNLAVPIMDAAGISHEKANVAAAHLMAHLLDCDTAAHPNYAYGKAGEA